MTVDFVSLAFIALIAFLCPIVAQSLPGKPISETVFFLLGGALAGPHVLNLIVPNEAISFLSDLGMSILFLLAGWEINPKNLTGTMGKHGFVTWLVTFVIAFAVVVAWPTFSAVNMDGIAVAIALSTTAIGTLLPILEERGVLKTPIGGAVLAYGTWGELLPVLAITVLLSTRSGVVNTIILLAFIAISVIAALLPKYFKRAGRAAYRFINKNVDTNAQMVVRAVMLLMVGLVTLSAIFDLDIVLGAFAAGFVLRYIIPKDDENIEAKMRTMGYGFFIPLFFISSGANIDITAITQQPELLVVFSVCLILVRTVPIVISLNFAKETRRWAFNNKLTVAIYCTTALPLIVAATSVAVSAGAMSQSTSSVLVSAGAISVLVMPVLAQIFMRTVDAQPINAVREIVDNPKNASAILKSHRKNELKRRKLYKQGPVEYASEVALEKAKAAKGKTAVKHRHASKKDKKNGSGDPE